MPLMRRGPGLIGTAARAGVAAGVAGRVHRRQQTRWAEQEQPADAEQPPAAALLPRRPPRPRWTTPPSSSSSRSCATRA